MTITIKKFMTIHEIMEVVIEELKRMSPAEKAAYRRAIHYGLLSAKEKRMVN